MANQKGQKRFVCSICGYPAWITYKTVNEEGKKVEERVEVDCLGHEGIHPAFWNKSADYNKYQMLRAKQHVNSGKVVE